MEHDWQDLSTLNKDSPSFQMYMWQWLARFLVCSRSTACHVNQRVVVDEDPKPARSNTKPEKQRHIPNSQKNDLQVNDTQILVGQDFVFDGQHSSLNSSDSCNYQPPSTTINHHQPPSTTIKFKPLLTVFPSASSRRTESCRLKRFFLDFDFSSAAEPIASIEIGEYQSGVLVGNNSRYLVVF